MKLIKIVVLLLFITVYKVVAQDTSLFNLENSKRFSEYLYKGGEYQLAIPEYKRVLFLNPKDTVALENLLNCYIKTSDFKNGITAIHNYDSLIFTNKKLLFTSGKIFVLGKRFDEYLKYELPSDIVCFHKISNSILEEKWNANHINWECIDKDSQDNIFTPYINQIEKTKFKSPALSLTMSAIIPGSGKIYSGYWKDGVVSFLFVSLSAWQSYRGFQEKGVNSYYGWLMGGISLSLYSGNLYGSFKAANKRNHNIKHEIANKFKNLYSNYNYTY